MINFQIIKKGKHFWKIFLSVLNIFKIQLGWCDLNLYVSNKFKTYSEIIPLNKV